MYRGWFVGERNEMEESDKREEGEGRSGIELGFVGAGRWSS